MADIHLSTGESFEHIHSAPSVTELGEGAVELQLPGSRVLLATGQPTHIPAGTRHALKNVGSKLAIVRCGTCAPPDGSSSYG